MANASTQIQEVERAISALWSIPCPPSRDEWWPIMGSAIDADIREETIRAWCESGPEFNEADFKSTYRSLARRPRSGADGALFKTARANGWRDDAQISIPSPAERDQRRVEAERRAAEISAEEAQRHEAAMRQAAEILKDANGDPKQHPYSIKKHVNLGGTVKRGPWPQRGWADALLIPGYDVEQRISTIEAINIDGTKDSLAGGRKRGAILPIKPFREGKADLVVIAEGVANAAAGAESCAASAVASLGASNMLHAGKIVRGLNPSAKIAFVADHDPSGTGLKYARKGALEVGGVVVDLAGLLPDAKFDAWDVIDQLGLDALGRAITKALEAGAETLQADIRAPVQPAVADASAQTQAVASARDEERRQQQKDENSRIQDLECGVMFPSKLSVDEMAEHLYWVAEGEMVAHVSDDRTMFLKYNEVRSLTAESVTFVEAENAKGKKKPVPNAVIWKSDPRRLNVMVPTFRAGGGIVCADPDGRKAVNIWRPTIRRESKADISLFIEHVEYLIEDEVECNAFLDWLAHLEQKPGELPHYGWLHVARHTGCGRNWLASVLARVWCGYVAPNVDLHALLDSPYNGVLSGRILAMVDEIQAGDGENYKHTNRLRSLLNQEVRNMNPKFGREYREHNACRWLVFSNHLNALPIDNTDRRWRVVVHNNAPRAADEYVKLYEALNNPEFINSVAVFLAKRDISKFKPGERPPMNKAKLSVVGASKTMTQQRAESIIDHWPSDIITNADVATILSDGATSYINPSMRRCVEELDAVAIERQIKIDGYPSRVWVIRNHENWHDGSANADIVKEVQRAREEARQGLGAQIVLADAMEADAKFAEAKKQQAEKSKQPSAISQPIVSDEHPFA